MGIERVYDQDEKMWIALGGAWVWDIFLCRSGRRRWTIFAQTEICGQTEPFEDATYGVCIQQSSGTIASATRATKHSHQPPAL